MLGSLTRFRLRHVADVRDGRRHRLADDLVEERYVLFGQHGQRQFAQVALALVLRAERQRPHGKLALGRQRRFLDPLAGNQGPVERPQVADHQQPVGLEHLAVSTADHRMGDAQAGIPTPADHGGQL